MPKKSKQNGHDAQVLAFQPGYIVIDLSSKQGGVHYVREGKRVQSVGEGEETRYSAIKHVDHVTMCRAVDSLVGRTAGLLGKYGARLGRLGWFVPREKYKHLQRDVRHLQEEAAALNLQARTAGCARRAEIRFFPIKLTAANKEAADEIARTVRIALTVLKQKLVAGDVQLGAALRNCKNLPQLAPGMQGDLIRFALDAAKRGQAQLKIVAESGGDLAAAGAQLNLAPIDHALALFAPYGESIEVSAEDEAEVTA